MCGVGDKGGDVLSVYGDAERRGKGDSGAVDDMKGREREKDRERERERERESER